MHKILATLSAVSVAGAIALAAASPAAAAPPYWNHHHYYHGGPGIGLGIGAGILGFAAGAALANSARANDGYYADSDSDHIASCQDAYKSYDIRSDTYLGYDGYRHECTL